VTAERQAFPARTAALAEVAAFVERRCLELAAGGEATLRVLLVAEELFINAVLHGYGGDCGATVRFTLRDKGREVEIVEEDDAIEFDPFRDLRPVRASADPAECAVGGAGRVLIAELSSSRAYQRRGASNRVTIGVLKSRDPLRAKKSHKSL
jgi:anti-sigma regulatory factor (Ser/Thr protein kinase)